MEFETNKTGRSHPLLLTGLSANVQKRGRGILPFCKKNKEKIQKNAKISHSRKFATATVL